jgi:hypothetical protein
MAGAFPSLWPLIGHALESFCSVTFHEDDILPFFFMFFYILEPTYIYMYSTDSTRYGISYIISLQHLSAKCMMIPEHYIPTVLINSMLTNI